MNQETNVLTIVAFDKLSIIVNIMLRNSHNIRVFSNILFVNFFHNIQKNRDIEFFTLNPVSRDIKM